MQTRVDAEIVVFNQKWVVSQNIRNAKVQNHKAKKNNQIGINNQEPEIRMQTKQTKARQESLSKGCRVQYLNKLAYK